MPLSSVAFLVMSARVVGTAIIIEEAEDRAAIAASSDFAQDLLIQAMRLRRLARASRDGVVHDELVELSAKCDAAAAAIIAHWHGHRDRLTSQLHDAAVIGAR